MAQAAGGVLIARGIEAVAGAVQNFVSDSIDAFGDFESAVAKIVAATGAVGDSAAQLRNRFSEVARAASVEMGVGAAEAASALESLVKAGLDGASAVTALKSALQLSKIEGIASADAANLLVSGLAQFRLGAEKATEVVDALSNASRLGIGTAAEYAGGLSYVGSAAASMGFTMQETLSALVLVDATQKDAVKSGRYLNAAFSDLISHQKELGFSLYDSQGKMLSLDEVVRRLTETVAGFGTQAERDAYLNEVFGEQGKRAALALMGQSSELVNLTEKMGRAGAANEMFAAQMDTFQGKMAKSKAAVEAFQTRMGEALAPVVTNLATVFVEKVLPALEILFMWLEKVGGVMAVQLKPLWDEMVNISKMLGDALKELAEAFGVQGEEAEATDSTLSLLLNAVLTPLKTALYFIVGVVRTVTAAWNAWKDLINSHVHPAVSAISIALEDTLGGAIETVQSAVQVLQGVWESTFNAMRLVWDNTLGPIVDTINSTVGKIIDAFNLLKDKLVGHSVWTDMLREMDAQTETYLSLIGRRFDTFTPEVTASMQYLEFTGWGDRLSSSTLSPGGGVTVYGPLVVIEGSADRATAELASQLVVNELRWRRR